jgi:hypothetical protein
MLPKRKNKGLLLLALTLLIFIPSIASFAETLIYNYDDLNRLKWVQYGDGTMIEYSYDEIGNRVDVISSACRLLADLNMDGAVSITDLVKVNRIANLLDPVQACADINNDGAVSISDVILTNRMSNGLDPLRCCNE